MVHRDERRASRDDPWCCVQPSALRRDAEVPDTEVDRAAVSADATERRAAAEAPAQASADASAALISRRDPDEVAQPGERRVVRQTAADHLAGARPAESLPVDPVHTRVSADQRGAVDQGLPLEIRLASEVARSACRAALPEERQGAERREPYRAQGFERRSAAAADEARKEPARVSALRLESGVAERESGGQARKLVLRPTQVVAVRSSAPEKPAVAQAEQKPDAALQPVDEWALSR